MLVAYLLSPLVAQKPDSVSNRAIFSRTWLEIPQRERERRYQHRERGEKRERERDRIEAQVG